MHFSAETKTIERIFQDEYLIPDYQRPYSWREDECQQLVDDVVAFQESSGDDSEARYFLGAIIITHTETERNRWIVIDGQQRLTTLLLLIKALEKQCDGGYYALKGCYSKRDHQTGEPSDFRMQSEIIRDTKNLECVLKGETHHHNNRFSRNFKHMDVWLKNRFGTIAALEKFIETLLYRVVLLPIRGDREANALTIFITQNDRGRPLTAVDIFKANLYKNVPDKEKRNFVSDWAKLLDNNGKDDDYDVERLFRIYMYVLRAKEKDTGSEDMRVYFRKHGRFGNPQEVMDHLEKYKAVDNRWKGIMPESDIWWHILKSVRDTIYWEYPLYVFLDKHATYEEGKLALSEQQDDEFTELIKATARYLFMMGVATNRSDTIKRTMCYRVCQDIAHGGDYHARYRTHSSAKKDPFKANLENCYYGDRYRDGLVLISSALHSSQGDERSREKRNREKYKEYKEFLDAGYEIEHILPYKWNHYDGWREETHRRDLHKLGNLIPLEERLNIAARNEFFPRKQEKYRQSKNPETRCLGEDEYGDKWLPETLQERNEDVLNRLRKFFLEGRD